MVAVMAMAADTGMVSVAMAADIMVLHAGASISAVITSLAGMVLLARLTSLLSPAILGTP